MLSATFGSIFPSLFLAFFCLFAANYTLTINKPVFIRIRLVLAAVAFWALWDACYSPYYYNVPKNLTTAPAAAAFFGIMRIFDACIVSIWDEKPPHWVVRGQVVPLPTTVSQRLAYALDLSTSVRGPRLVLL